MAHREDGINALDTTFNRCAIAKIPGNDLGSELGQLARGRRVGLAGEGMDAVAVL